MEWSRLTSHIDVGCSLHVGLIEDEEVEDIPDNSQGNYAWDQDPISHVLQVSSLVGTRSVVGARVGRWEAEEAQAHIHHLTTSSTTTSHVSIVDSGTQGTHHASLVECSRRRKLGRN